MGRLGSCRVCLKGDTLYVVVSGYKAHCMTLYDSVGQYNRLENPINSKPYCLLGINDVYYIRVLKSLSGRSKKGQ